MNETFHASMIARAAGRLAGKIVRTPVINSPMLDEAAGCRVFVKAEPLQRTGAFNFRGALNKLLTLEPEVRARGVVAFSSGNHGHAVAAAAAELGCPAVIVLPNDAAEIKVANCRWWGAEIVLYDPHKQDREEAARSVAEPRGMLAVPPFDDFDIIAGQGTLGLEFAEQLAGRGIEPSAFAVPCSGGGLGSGSVAVMKDAFPGIGCYIVEPAGLEKMAPSIASGTPQKRPAGPPTIMDGISGPIAGTKPLAILKSCKAMGLSVSDKEALEAMAAAYRFLKLVVEPEGAAALGAVLARKADFAGKSVAVVCSGGNVDPEIFARALAVPWFTTPA
jgi:threonine dehydratase